LALWREADAQAVCYASKELPEKVKELQERANRK